MRVVLRMAGSAFADLAGLLRAAEPLESGAFLLVGHSVGADVLRLTVRAVLRPPSHAWKHRARDVLALSTRWMSEVLGLADAEGLGLVFVHSHPGLIGGPGFSEADEWMHDGMVPVFTDNLDGRPFGSLVYHHGRLQGSAWFRGNRLDVERVVVVDREVQEVGPPSGANAEADGAYNRQVLLWGAEGQRRLGELRVGVVGAGGTGSATAEQLVRLGVGSVVVIDHDRLDPGNVTRVYGSTLADVGKYKADVVAGWLKSIRATEVTAIPDRVESERAIEALLDCDVIFGCTDTHGSRAVLNDIAYQHMIPVIDVGCRVGVRDGKTDGIGCEVRVLVPDAGCLWCSGAIDGQRIHDECLSAEERKALGEEGYVKGLDSQPSIIPVTTITASLGVLRGLGMFLGLVDWPDERTVVDLHGLALFTVAAPPIEGCTCRARVGIGAARPIAVPTG